MSYLAMPVVLDISSSATIAASATPQLLTLPDTNQSINADYNSATGVITIKQAGTYFFSFQFMVTSLLSGRISYYPEVDTGAGFATIPKSCRTDVVQILTSKLISFGASRYFKEGDRLRGYIFGTGYTLQAITPVNSPVECPAVRILMSS